MAWVNGWAGDDLGSLEIDDEAKNVGKGDAKGENWRCRRKLTIVMIEKCPADGR
jgi:hypothetical protein